MSAADLLDQLAASGVTARLIPPDTLRLCGDAGAQLDDQLVHAVRAAKADILALLRSRARSGAYPCACCGQFFFAEPSVMCYWCRRDAVRS